MLRKWIAHRFIAWGDKFYTEWFDALDDSWRNPLLRRLADIFYALASRLGSDPY